MTQRERLQPAKREATAIALRMVAPTLDELRQAVDTMRLRHGHDVAFNNAREGKRGEWLCYGTLFVRHP